ncbi:MAG: hypothetical protein IPH35_22675 [Rhodoferax sp.]|nr:hypothetical protein [Rhodoferax sp.]
MFLNTLPGLTFSLLLFGGSVCHVPAFAQHGDNSATITSNQQEKRSKRSVASNQTGVIDSNAEIEGVTIINDSVYIDGERVPNNVTRFKGRKSGLTYSIKWGRNGNISVTQP